MPFSPDAAPSREGGDRRRLDVLPWLLYIGVRDFGSKVPIESKVRISTVPQIAASADDSFVFHNPVYAVCHLDIHIRLRLIDAYRVEI